MGGGIRGRFITVEGVEGAGKTTHLPFIHACLTGAGLDVLTTREPGGTPLGESLRRLLLEPRDDPMASDTELLLMFAARAEHLDKAIRPALEQGQWVLCDRFTDATYAYQGGGRGIDESRIATLEDWVQGGLRPDLTLILDVSVPVGMRRVHGRGEHDRFEREDRPFFERIRESYLRRARRHPERYRVIDASGSIDDIQVLLRDTLDQYLKP